MLTNKVSFRKICSFLFNKLWITQSYQIKIRTIIVFLLVISVIIANICLPIVFKQVIDETTNVTETSLGIWLFIFYGALWLFIQIFTHIRELISIKIFEVSTKQLVTGIFKHLNNLSLDFHLKKKLGNIVSIFEKAENGIPYFYYGVLFFVFPLTIEVLTSGFILSKFIGLKYAILIFFVIISYIALNIYGSIWQSEAQREKNQVDVEAKGLFVDRLINYETIKYLGRVEKETSYLNEILTKKQKLGIKSFYRANFLNLLQSLIIGIAFLYIIIDAGWKVLHKEISMGDFIMLNTYFIQLSAPLRFIGNIFREIKNSLTDIELIINLSELEEEKSSDESLLINEIKEIKFDNVSFGYEKNNLILKNISFTVKEGEKIGIVGSTGSGKSTIIRLLYKFYKPIGGNIYINNIDIDKIDTNVLRNKLGVIAQDTLLFNESIRYNLSPNNENNLLEVIRETKLEQTINKLPKGLESVVGDRGIKLSGGERQRIGLARILLKDPEMIICDEFTSALDYKTEKDIIKYLDERFKDKIQIVIAHRLTTILNANKIIYIENGIVSEQGAHYQLIANEGGYYKLWQYQQRDQITISKST